jgi:hypothetical protein
VNIIRNSNLRLGVEKGTSPAVDGLAVATLALAVWFLYGGIIKLWWMGDDLFHLHALSVHSALAYFFSPRVWSLFPSKMFTPLQLLSYGTDARLFGWIPEWFYAHQLLALAVAAVGVYATLRSWLSPRFAWAAACLFLLGIPSASWVIELMLRHYIEGLIWAALAVWFFVKAVRRKHPAAVLLSSLFYLLAMLEKEIYIPLIALLLILPEGVLNVRLRVLRAHAVALVLYLGWRWAMLGTVLGGYGWATRSQELPGLLVELPAKLGGTLFGGLHASSALLGASLLAGAGLLIWRRPNSVPVAVIATILILGPIVPVAKSVSARFGTLPWLLVTILFVFGCRELSAGGPTARLVSIALLLIAITAALTVNRLDWRRRYSAAERMSAEGRFFLSMQPGDLLRHPLIPAAAMKETRWLKEEHLRLPRASGWFADDIYLCGVGAPRGRIWEFDESARQVRDVTDRALKAAARYCSRLRVAPLQARFELAGGNLFWTLGPYERGSYSLVLDKGVESFAVARADGYRETPGRFSVMLRYESPAGWVTYSPELIMDFGRAARFRWERGETAP